MAQTDSGVLPPSRPISHDLDDGHGYEFLQNTAVDTATLAAAIELAKTWNVTPHDVLMSKGWVHQDDYYRALAASCGVQFVGKPERDSLAPLSRTSTPRAALRSRLLRHVRNGRIDVAYAPGPIPPGEIRRRLSRDSNRLTITTPRVLRTTIQRAFAKQLTAQAIHGLTRRFPDESAGQGLTAGQRVFFALLSAGLAISLLISPLLTLHTVAGIVTLFFGLVVSLRIAACINMLVFRPFPRQGNSTTTVPDADLPVYTILVPLFREKAVLPQLTKALLQLDYPAAKLDIKLIFESSDPETLAAAKALNLPACFDFITVPDSLPRTKPKALNYALQFARGEFTVIYDAEDRPEPSQLKKALAAFNAGPVNLACVQARLTIYNEMENWFTRQFAIEYAALFAGLLPTLQRLRLPIPLGGTSNHFRTAALKWLGAWDAFNVTEDADLGMRLYRHGYVCHVIDSDTEEEAPIRFRAWLQQRTRWLKGWIQTYFVHMRAPLKLRRELGTRGFLGFQITVGGMILSALAYPLFFLILAIGASTQTLFRLPANILELHVWLVAICNVTVGYLAVMALSLIAVLQQGKRLAMHVVFIPAYWLLISLAAYRALGQLLTQPFHWEKTEHGVSRMPRSLKKRSNRKATEPVGPVAHNLSRIIGSKAG